MPGRVLHVLSQRPSHTGSGVTLGAIVRCAGEAGWEQSAVVGVPAEDPHPAVGTLPPERIFPLVFGREELDFDLPGMSDVMPYPSTCFSELTAGQHKAYRSAWTGHLREVVDRFRPDLIHSHHVWILSSLIKDVIPRVPVVTQSHATGFRQMALCPDLAPDVKAGCARNERFLVLHEEMARWLTEALGVPAQRVSVCGAGYRQDLFHTQGRPAATGPDVAYVGKLSRAKGLPWLLEAVERLWGEGRDVRLHVAGSGAGEEAAELGARLSSLAPRVLLHGQLSQEDLAGLLRRCAVCALPSFYEGLGLVLVEALACGCRLVSTDFEGARDQIAPHAGEALELVPMPRLGDVDKPEPSDLPAFVENLAGALGRSLDRPGLGDDAFTAEGRLRPFTWEAVFQRVEEVWTGLLRRGKN
jgi:glycosyltransferase involved in cell wall biosynthesis